MILCIFESSDKSFMQKPVRCLFTITGVASLPIPMLSQIPVIGNSLFSQDIMEYLAFVTLVLVIFVISRTTFVLNLRSVGENPSAAGTLGVSVARIRHIAVIAGATLAGIGGAYLAPSSHAFQAENITAGRGFSLSPWYTLGNGAQQERSLGLFSSAQHTCSVLSSKLSAQSFPTISS